jgi:hypothetical protein
MTNVDEKFDAFLAFIVVINDYDFWISDNEGGVSSR